MGDSRLRGKTLSMSASCYVVKVFDVVIKRVLVKY